MSAPPVVTVSQENVNNIPALLTTGGRTIYTISCTTPRRRYALSSPHNPRVVATIGFYPMSTKIYVTLRD